MIEFFELRTREHIARVAANLLRLAEVTDHGDALAQRAAVHDASKFGPAEKLPYVWLTHFHRCRRNGEPFVYPPGVEAQVAEAIEHHLTTNRHHYQCHADPNQMTDVDLIEMVCDWTAMSQEFDQDGGSARGWAARTIGTQVEFNARNSELIYRTIDQLDRLNGVERRD